MDLATLKAIKPSEYSDAADGYRTTSDGAASAKERVDSQIIRAMRQALRGEAAKAAIQQLQSLSEDFHYVQVECGLAATALEAFAYDMEAAKKKLVAALEDAQAAKFTVDSAGTVTYPAGGEKSDGRLPEGGAASGTMDPTVAAINRQAGNFDPNPNYRLAQDIADRITAALQEATDADGKWAPKLRALKADDDLTVSSSDWADVQRDTGGVLKGAADYMESLPHPPTHGTPGDNAAWWKSLTDEQRADYLSVHPSAVGAMNGLPADIRDEANRTVFSEAHGKAALGYAAWLKEHPEPEKYTDYINPMTGTVVKGVQVESQEWLDWQEAREDARAPLGGMEAIQTRFDSYQSDDTRPYLLGFDDKANGRVIVSVGNPDTADNVVTYVPGTGSKLGSIDGDISRAELVQDQAVATDPAHKTASIVWLGYDAPQDLLGDATDAKYADAAREPLSNFLTGIDTVHEGDVRSTVLGHSYGTLVAGETMRDHPHLPVDTAILVGSPGVGVDHAKDLNIPADHVYAATAKNDLVNLAPPPAGTLAPLNPKAYMRLFDDHSIMYGNDPTSDEFGGRTFKVADGKPPGSDGLMPAHSQYWEGDSLKRMGTIVTGGTP
ncbi:alpha/beta hydrolase [Streptomyces sp. NBC_01601]|uniref:alpha/beta hydrolase n=1 Tax=Streptomyces sp. NBC_01601 TaxID=2975892 RepID=UPI002E2BDCFC|nr:alpha/beta hydrolase [Streptomyces sp. NBC_01601]